jgi:hypothetical protein
MTDRTDRTDPLTFAPSDFTPTLAQAQAWARTEEKFSLCVDLLEVSAHNSQADRYVERLEYQFTALLFGTPCVECAGSGSVSTGCGGAGTYEVFDCETCRASGTVAADPSWAHPSADGSGDNVARAGLAGAFELFRAGLASLCHPDPELCECKGGGWILSALDTWHACSVIAHRTDQHPEDGCDEGDVEDELGRERQLSDWAERTHGCE